MATPLIPKLLGGGLMGTGIAFLGHRASNLREEGSKTKLYSHGASLPQLAPELRGLPDGPCDTSFTVKKYLFHTDQANRDLSVGYASGRHKSWLQMKDIGKKQEGAVIDFTAESPDGSNPTIRRTLFNTDPYFEDGTIIKVKKIQKVAPDVTAIKEREELLQTEKRTQASVFGNSYED